MGARARVRPVDPAAGFNLLNVFTVNSARRLLGLVGMKRNLFAVLAVAVSVGSVVHAAEPVEVVEGPWLTPAESDAQRAAVHQQWRAQQAGHDPRAQAPVRDFSHVKVHADPAARPPGWRNPLDAMPLHFQARYARGARR